jgi:hypothetical protein
MCGGGRKAAPAPPPPPPPKPDPQPDTVSALPESGAYSDSVASARKNKANTRKKMLIPLVGKTLGGSGTGINTNQ